MGLERFATRGSDAALPGPVLRAFADPQPREGEVCGLCARPIGDDHRHLVDLTSRTLECSCRGCALLFVDDAGGPELRYRVVPEEYRAVTAFELERSRWTSLRIPVDLAFVMEDSVAERAVAFYPSPAGATESELPDGAWDEIVAANPTLAELEADVQAVLVRVRDGHAPEAYVVPIDRCYELVGHLRLNWRGFGGGQEVRRTIDDFFAEVRSRSRAPAAEVVP